MDLAWRIDAEPGEHVTGRLGQFGALPERPGGPGEGAQVDPAEFAAHLRPGRAGGVLGDADEQQREPAQQHVGADPLFEPVAGRPQVQDGLHVPPAALDFEELLVADGDVLGGQLRVGAAQQVLAVQVLFRLGLGLVGAQQPAGGDPQEPVQPRFSPGIVEIFPRSSARLVAVRFSTSHRPVTYAVSCLACSITCNETFFQLTRVDRNLNALPKGSAGRTQIIRW